MTQRDRTGLQGCAAKNSLQTMQLQNMHLSSKKMKFGLSIMGLNVMKWAIFCINFLGPCATIEYRGGRGARGLLGLARGTNSSMCHGVDVCIWPAWLLYASVGDQVRCSKPTDTNTANTKYKCPIVQYGRVIREVETWTLPYASS